MVRFIIIIVGILCILVPVFYLLSNFLIWGYLITIGNKRIRFIQVIKKYRQGAVPLTIVLSLSFLVALLLNALDELY